MIPVYYDASNMCDCCSDYRSPVGHVLMISVTDILAVFVFPLYSDVIHVTVLSSGPELCGLASGLLYWQVLWLAV